MLGLGRAMGETIAVALVIGSRPRSSANLFAPGDAMPAVIANQFGESSGTYRAALIGLGVVLFAMTIIVNVAARCIVGRAEVRMRGRGMTADRSPPPTGAATSAVRRSLACAARRRRGPHVGDAALHVRCVAGRSSRSASSSYYVIAKGVDVISWATSSPTDIPIVPRKVGPGMGPAVVGTLRHHRAGAADGHPARRPRRDLPQRVRQAGPPRQAHPLHVRRDDRRAVDRHGPVHLHRLGAALQADRASPARWRWPA